MMFLEASDLADNTVMNKYELKIMKGNLRLGRIYEHYVLTEIFVVSSVHKIGNHKFTIQSKGDLIVNSGNMVPVDGTCYIPTNCNFPFHHSCFKLLLTSHIKSLKEVTFSTVEDWFLVWVVPPRLEDIFTKKVQLRTI